MNIADPKISISVCERDIDFFLIEEFVSSPAFLAWFMNSLGISGALQLVDVRRSVTTSTGESDVEVTIAQGNSSTKVLIENKIDAAFQSRQAERYAERAESYCANGKCNSVITVLVAPKSYVGLGTDTSGFERHVSYESILDWYSQHETGLSRALFKCELLRRAIEKSETGSPLIPDEKAISFWQKYSELASSTAPRLGMPPTGQRGAESQWIYFRPVAIRRGVKLVHKMPLGSVDLEVTGYGSKILDFKRKHDSSLESDMRIVAVGRKSLAVRISVPTIGLEMPFSACESAALDGIRAASRLLNWYESVLGPTLAKLETAHRSFSNR